MPYMLTKVSIKALTKPIIVTLLHNYYTFSGYAWYDEKPSKINVNITTNSLINHSHMVAIAMQAYAQKKNKDEK